MATKCPEPRGRAYRLGVIPLSSRRIAINLQTPQLIRARIDLTQFKFIDGEARRVAGRL
jgi:hypothetical protein